MSITFDESQNLSFEELTPEAAFERYLNIFWQLPKTRPIMKSKNGAVQSVHNVLDSPIDPEWFGLVAAFAFAAGDNAQSQPHHWQATDISTRDFQEGTARDLLRQKWIEYNKERKEAPFQEYTEYFSPFNEVRKRLLGGKYNLFDDQALPFESRQYHHVHWRYRFDYDTIVEGEGGDRSELINETLLLLLYNHYAHLENSQQEYTLPATVTFTSEGQPVAVDMRSHLRHAADDILEGLYPHFMDPQQFDQAAFIQHFTDETTRRRHKADHTYLRRVQGALQFVLDQEKDNPEIQRHYQENIVGSFVAMANDQQVIEALPINALYLTARMCLNHAMDREEGIRGVFNTALHMTVDFEYYSRRKQVFNEVFEYLLDENILYRRLNRLSSMHLPDNPYDEFNKDGTVRFFLDEDERTYPSDPDQTKYRHYSVKEFMKRFAPYQTFATPLDYLQLMPEGMFDWSAVDLGDEDQAKKILHGGKSAETPMLMLERAARSVFLAFREIQLFLSRDMDYLSMMKEYPFDLSRYVVSFMNKEQYFPLLDELVPQPPEQEASLEHYAPYLIAIGNTRYALMNLFMLTLARNAAMRSGNEALAQEIEDTVEHLFERYSHMMPIYQSPEEHMERISAHEEEALRYINDTNYARLGIAFDRMVYKIANMAAQEAPKATYPGTM